MPSSVRPTRESSLRIRLAPEEVTLRDWPLVDRPIGSLAAIGLAAGLSWLAGWATGSVFAGGGAALFLALILWRTWLPVRYELNSSGITQTVLGWRRRIPWTSIQGHELRAGSVLLVPDAAIAPLSPLRGLVLPWGRQKSAVLAHLDYYVQPWNSPSRSTLTDTAEPRL